MSSEDSRLKVYLELRSRLIDYATPILGCSNRAEDVVQEAYFRFIPAQTTVNQPINYLYRIVKNLALDLRRSLQSEARRNTARAEYHAAEPLTASPEEHAYYRDELKKVEEVLAMLPPKAKLAFEMHRLSGKTFEQIGIELGVSTATAARWTKDAFNCISEVLE